MKPFFRFTLGAVFGEVQILDYTNSQIITISNGKAKIQEGNFKLIHVIELDKFQKFIDETSTIIQEHLTESNHLYPYMNHEISQIQESLNRIKPRRSKRSLNFIGSAWKWIAGNPDHDDFVIIKQRMNNVLENNDKQVVINKIYNERINNLTKITNEIENSLRKESSVKNNFILSLKYKLKIIKEELINIEYAIHWAKAGIVNSLILSTTEVKLAVENIEKGKLPYVTIEEALDFADVRIVTNASCLLYIVNIPVTTKKVFEKIIVKPVKRNNFVSLIEFENVIKFENELYGINGNCNNFKKMSICKPNNLVDMMNSTCLPNLLQSLPSRCKRSNHQHIPDVEEITEGLLLLNQFNGNISVSNKLQNLNGTFLVKFHNESITIGRRAFISKERITHQIMPAILQPTPDENQFERVLSLPMLEEINIENTKKLKTLTREKFIHQCSTYSMLTILFAITVFLGLRKNQRDLQILTKMKKKSAAIKKPENNIQTIRINMDQ